MTYRPFIGDSAHLALLEGQRYVVLRPGGQVVESYDRAKSAVLSLLEGKPSSSPSFPHVTLIGFPSGTDLDHVVSALADWVNSVPPLMVETHGLGTFPYPFQTVIATVTKTPALTQALTSIRTHMAASGLPEWPDRRPSVDDWTFHMSLAYCSGLTSDEWSVVTTQVEPLTLEPADCLVAEVEVVAYDNARERSGAVLALGGKT